MRFFFAMAVLGAALAVLIWNHDAGTTFGLGNDAFARVVVFGVLAITIAAGVLQSREHRFGDLARAALLWVVVILGLVAAYGYRDDLTAVAGRVQGLLMPGTPTTGPEPNSIAVAKSMDGHFRARAMIDGKPVTLVIDTGASDVVLTSRDAAGVGLDPATLVYSARISTANGETTAAPVRLGAVTVGSITIRGVRALVARPGALEQSLLGMSFLARLKSFTVEQTQLVMRP